MTILKESSRRGLTIDMVVKSLNNLIALLLLPSYPKQVQDYPKKDFFSFFYTRYGFKKQYKNGCFISLFV